MNNNDFTFVDSNGTPIDEEEGKLITKKFANEIEQTLVLEAIEEGDETSTNGGHYVPTEDREIAERLVERGDVVRMKNPAGQSPIYVPVDSDHYSDERLDRMSERQSGGGENK